MHVTGDPEKEQREKMGKVTFEEMITKKFLKQGLQQLFTKSNCSNDPKRDKYQVSPV